MNNLEVQSIVISICKSYLTGQALEADTIKSSLSTDPKEIIQYAKAHKLVTILTKVVGSDPLLSQSKLNNRLKYWNDLIVKHNLQLRKEAETIKQLFRNEAIHIDDYKGTQFTSLFYPDLSFRKSIDVDFAIDVADLTKVKAIMTRQGFREAKSQKFKSENHKRKIYLDYPFVRDNNDGNKLLVEFHIAPAHKALYVPYDFNSRFQKDKSPFSLVEHAFYIIVHHGAVDLWGKLMHLIDLNAILEKLTDSEIIALQDLCKTCKIHRILTAGCYLLEDIFGVKPKLKYSNVKRQKIEKLKSDIIKTDMIANWSKNKRKMRYHISLRDDLLSKCKSIYAINKYFVYSRLMN